MEISTKETRTFTMTLNNDLRERALKVAKRKSSSLSLSTLMDMALTKYCDEAEKEMGQA